MCWISETFFFYRKPLFGPNTLGVDILMPKRLVVPVRIWQ